MTKTTANCVICGNPVKGYFGGHVHKEQETIIAGFCSKEHLHAPHVNNGCKGCYGEWTERMGIHEKAFGQLVFIDKDGVHSIDDEDI